LELNARLNEAGVPEMRYDIEGEAVDLLFQELARRAGLGARPAEGPGVRRTLA
jgi:hypothetical protein